MELDPLLMLVGLALKLTVGAGVAAAFTVTVADCWVVPPAPVQESCKFGLVVSAAVLLVPLVATVPLQAPEAVQVVALVDDQVSVELDPLLMLVGLALKLTVGAGVTDAPVTVTVADCSVVPPDPVQDKL